MAPPVARQQPRHEHSPPAAQSGSARAPARPRPERVWIVNHYATAPDGAAGVRHFTLARALAKRGIDVTVFAAGYEHGAAVETRVRGGSAARSAVMDGVRFVWLRTVPYRGNSWRRILNMLSFAMMMVLVEVGRARPDVVIASSPHPFAALAAWYVSKRRGARFLYEVRDLWPQTFVDLGAMDPGSPTARLLWAIESFLVRKAEAFISLLPGIAAYLRSRGLPTDTVRYLPNGPDLALFDARTDGSVIPASTELGRLLARVEAWQRDGEVVFAYTGAHGRVNRLSIVLRAIAAANGRGGSPFRVVFVGDGPEKETLIDLASSSGLDNVSFEDAIPNKLLPAFLAAVDVGIVHTTATPVYQYGISFNKLFDYMAARLPIVFACETAYDPVEASHAGITVAPDDPEALASALIAIAELEPAERGQMGDLGRTYVEREHDMAVLGARFAEIVGVDTSSPDAE